MVKSTKEILKFGKELLTKNNIDSREARLLLAHALKIEPSDLIRYNSCTEAEYARYTKFLQKRIEGEPFSYIVGYKEFMKLKFEVNKNVLIPRDDTETLVLEAIKLCKDNILDLCTGSGCIAISLAKYLKNSKIDAVDICQKALNVAKKNALSNEVDVNFIKSNLFEKVNKKYDLIVSNPPYIRTDDLNELQIEVKKEPKKALDGGVSGLDFYERILADAKKFLNENGIIIFEIGYDQTKDVSDIMKKYNYKKIKIVKDLNKNDRVILAERG